ncbi:olfactory receptor 52K1-like [Anomaloglossus baeobatrachus]|uniref:olfactory receptor 52K1-like n=1 Tax=Anomaloglossus baeobatrachus TaxID=238106 RepID=UPI003F4F6598
MEASGLNRSVSFSYTEFILLPFPGVTFYRQILVVPVFVAYSLILVLNLLIPFTVWWERSLHAPMYILIGLLLTVNVISTTTVIPQMLLSFLGQNRISLSSCLAQMFFVYSAIMFKSLVFLLMAFDRFVAVCHPLRYYDIISKNTFLQMWAAGLARNCILVSLVVFLASRVQYCKSNLIQNFVCEYVVLLSLACGDVSRAQLVGLLVRTVVTVSDVTILLVCYLRVLHVALKIAVGSRRHKALRTCGMHLLVALTVYSCGFLSSILYKAEESISPDSQNLSSIIYFLFPAALNPVIYGLGVNEIKDCLVKKLMANIWGQQALVSRVVR